MEINIKDNIYFRTYDKKVKLNEDIVDFILSDKIDKVLYKGEPNDINYKLLVLNGRACSLQSLQSLQIMMS